MIAYDSRARTEYWPGPYDLYDLAKDCSALMDELCIDRCVLIGMSMGGWMALRFALKYPKKLHALILIDSSANTDDLDRQSEFDGRFEGLRGSDRLPSDFVDWVIPQMFGAWTRRYNPGLVRSWREKFATYSGDAVYAEAESWRHRDDLSKSVATIGIPTLVVHGAEDTAEPISDVQPMVDAMPNARLQVIDRAGQFVESGTTRRGKFRHQGVSRRHSH